MKKFFYLSLMVPFLTAALFTPDSSVPEYVPGENEWLQFRNPADIGFDTVKLTGLKSFFDSLQAHSLLVLYQGKIVFNWGDNVRRMPCASIRKSLLSALYGVAVGEETIDINQTICELDLAVTMDLDSVECTARIRDLLSATSGIYLPAAYEPEVWTRGKPSRGSHAPGAFWYYNNWDFNTLGVIYNHLSAGSIADDFKRKIAEPLGMQDFRSDWDFKYFYERDIPVPAYLFKLSTRDLARFGLLYLREGRWGQQQIVPSPWVSESTRHLQTPWDETGYGYLWWSTYLSDHTRVFYASGSGTQGVFVIPSRDLVIVFRADTYLGPEVANGQDLKVVEMICEAQDLPSGQRRNPECVPVRWDEFTSTEQKIDPHAWLGSYENNVAREIRVTMQGKDLVLQTRIADFRMYLDSDTTGWVEDLQIPVYLDTRESGKATSILNKDRLVLRK